MHKQTESKDEKNWGYAGDLEYIVSRLQDASDFLNNEGEYAEVAQW
jgi:hypothetical protein